VKRFRTPGQAKRHIIDRAVERFFQHDEDKRPEAEALLGRALAALEAQTPDDWRFTRHPSARFFISVVHPRPISGRSIRKDAQLKLLGRTYRVSRPGQELIKRLRKYVRQIRSSGSPEKRLDELRAMAELYLKDLQDPQARIVHEFKTAYTAAGQLPHQRAWQRKRLEDYRHTAILRGLKVPKLYASLPNALLCAEKADDERLTLWVRQADSWTCPRLDVGSAVVYALFCRLTKEGPALESGQIWRFDGRGNIQREGAAEVRALLGAGWQKPAGYRSESYWVLPTRLDALWLDHDYLYREKAHTMTATKAATLTVINWIYDLALAQAGVSDPPAWHSKSKPK